MIVKGKEPMTFDLEWVGQDPDTPSIRLRKKSPPGQPWESARLSWRGEALVIKGDRMSDSMVLIPLAGKTSK